MVQFKRAGILGFIALMAMGGQAQILIGQTAGYSGAVAAGVKETFQGASLYLNAVNAKGGVHGQKIEVVSMDDKFDPKLAVSNARVLIEEKKVVAMFLTRGTPHAEAIVPLLDKSGTPLIAPSTGAMVLHQPVKRHVFNVRATYQREAEKAVLHLGTLGIQRIALVQTDDSFGADGAVGVLKGLKGAGLTAVVHEKFDRDKPDFSKITRKVIAADAQAVMMIASGSDVVSGVGALRAAGSAAQVVTLSNNASGGFIKNLGDKAHGVVVTQVFPSERSVAYPMIKDAQSLLKGDKDSPELSPAMLEGFAAAKVLVEALQRAGPGPTRAKVQAALEGMKKFDLGGLEISYSTGDHTGLDFADLSIISANGKFKR